MIRSVRSLSISLLVLIGSLTACGGQSAQTDTVINATPVPPTIAAESLPVDSNNVALVARVNGQAITLPTFERALERRQQVVDASDPTALRAEVLDQLIEQVLIEQAAVQQNLVVTDDEVQTELQSNMALAGSDAAWQDWLNANLYTQEEFVTTLREILITNRIRDAVTADLQGNVPQVHARHILVATEAEANDLLAQFQAGADFTGLAAAHSLDTSTREAGGDLGWFSRDGLMTPQLAEAAFALQPGAIAGPIATSLGYHVIQTLEVADRPVEPDMVAYVSQVRFENWLQKQRDSATIEVYLP